MINRPLLIEPSLKKPLLIVLGPQGSGKSTQAKLLSEKYNLPIFITGDQLRTFALCNSEESINIKKILSTGQLVPNETVYHLIESFCKDNNTEHGFIIDGFPRSLDQCRFVTDLSKKGNFFIIGVNVDISLNTTFERLRNRANHQTDSQKRDDDKPEIIEERLNLFREETEPVLKWLNDKYKLLNINGEPSVEKVFQDIVKQLSLDG